ncbi:HNH endonuclease [Desulfobulbus oligotrophicus]|uniref:HNH endonuclease n=1 Tax=Desulfobulbus oligotrophicus TaxID=1909699 RepID=A0A7T5VDB8_9BACT|nr:HNH endonuclease [Desulfobulbus oligotrophicus]QQG65679.1 HNH endonuclease [Desulfobulbus oligotrophicus]
MTKAVLTTKVNPTYDDLPEERYHFPGTYLGQIEKAIGDWIIYYEPRRISGDLSSRGGRQSYFATARLLSIERDHIHKNHYYAFVADYLEFDHAVPFKEGHHYYESSLQRKNDGKTNRGAFGRAVRLIPDKEYDLILQAGFTKSLEATVDENQTLPVTPYELGEEMTHYERSIIERIVARPFRDVAFAVSVKEVYQDTCAMTGLKIINGGGRAEVQAAHIQPVSQNGPDSIRNGIALSGTVHWMFDRGLVSIDDDYSILVAMDRLPDTVMRLLNENRRLILPPRTDVRPHRHYLNYHRENIFKG